MYDHRVSCLQGQGLGFTVFGTVIDIGMLKKIFTALVSFLLTVVPIILTLHQNHGEENEMRDAANQCGTVTEMHRLLLQGTMALVNASCTWNMTVGPNGVIIN